MHLHVKVKPNSASNEIIREADGGLKIKIKAPPVEGKANKYLINFLSEVLDLPVSKIQLSKGQNSQYKTLIIDAEEVYVMSKLSEQSGT